MAEKDISVPIEHKLALTVNEAAEYSNIGQNRIAKLLQLPDCPFLKNKCPKLACMNI